MKKISFDYDSTLSLPRYQRLAKWYVDSGYDVYITTARFELEEHNLDAYPFLTESSNDDLEEDCLKAGISLDKIRYVGTDNKSIYLEDFEMHYDDNYNVILDIEEADIPCLSVWVR